MIEVAIGNYLYYYVLQLKESDMDITLTLNDIILLLLGIAGLILIIFLIIFVKHLSDTVKNANKVVEDAGIVSGIAAERAQDIDKIASDITASVHSVAENLKGKDGIVKTVSAVVGLVTTLKGLLKKAAPSNKDDKDGKGKKDASDAGKPRTPRKQQKKI
jgi:uncharacterized protein YoxC